MLEKNFGLLGGYMGLLSEMKDSAKRYAQETLRYSIKENDQKVDIHMLANGAYGAKLAFKNHALVITLEKTNGKDQKVVLDLDHNFHSKYDVKTANVVLSHGDLHITINAYPEHSTHDVIHSVHVHDGLTEIYELDTEKLLDGLRNHGLDNLSSEEHEVLKELKSILKHVGIGNQIHVSHLKLDSIATKVHKIKEACLEDEVSQDVIEIIDVLLGSINRVEHIKPPQTNDLVEEKVEAIAKTKK